MPNLLQQLDFPGMCIIVFYLASELQLTGSIVPFSSKYWY